MAATCSFCGTEADRGPLFSGQMRAGTGEPQFICLECATNVRDRADATEGHCTFCDRDAAIVLAGDQSAICSRCLEVCLEVSSPMIIKP